MKTLIFVLVLVHLCATQQGPLNGRCLYIDAPGIGNGYAYTCMLSRKYINPTEKAFTIVSEHQKGYTDAKVLKIVITDCDVPILTKSLMTAIFEKFSLVTHLEVFHSKVQRIEPGAFDLPAAKKNLLNIQIMFNNITVIEDGTFAGLQNLESLRIVNNRIQVIEQGAFDDLEKLGRLELSYNNIKKLPVKLLKALVKLTNINIDHNQLKVIDDDLFYFNSDLRSIYARDNSINAIGENFLAGLYQFSYISLENNLCSNTYWRGRESAMRYLQECFDNYKKQ